MDALMNMLRKRPSLYSEGQSPIYGSSAADTLRQSPMRANEPADLYGLQMAEQSETSDRMFQNERLGNVDELKALKGLFMRKQDEIRQGTVEQQRPQVEHRMAELSAALSQGYGGTNPTGDMAAYGRQMGERRLNAPIEAARVAGQYDVDQANASGRAMRDVATIQGETSTRNQNLINDQMAAAMRGRTQGGPQPSLNFKSGAIGATPRAANPNLNPLLNQFSISQRNLGGADPWDDNNASNPAVQEHRSRWAGILAQHDAQQDAKADVQEILQRSDLRGLSIEDLFDTSATDPQYLAEVSELLSIARGGR